MSGLTATERPVRGAMVRPLAVGTALRETMLDAAVVAVSCLVFLGLCLYQLQLPGLYPDEAFDVIPAMQLLLGHPVELQRNIGLHIFGLDLPLMSSSDYQGVTSTYMALPFFALGGINVVSLRAMTVTVGLIGVVLTYFLARAWFGRPVARLAVVLIAVSPAWVFWSRLGVYVVSQVMPIGAGALLALTHWVRGRPFGKRNGVLYLGAFLLGLGLTTKLLFLWFIAAVVLTSLILWGRPIWERRRAWLAERHSWLRMCLWSGLAFCLGASPFIVYNVLSGGTFNLLRHTISAPGSTGHGVNNSAFLRNLWTEADAFKVLLDGGYFWFQGKDSATYANPLTPAFFALAALGLVAFMLYDRSKQPDRSSGGLIWRFDATTIALLAAVVLSIALATGIFSGSPARLAVLITCLLGIAGTVLLVRRAMRNEGETATVGWMLFAITAFCGALWWFGGAGRPEGAALGAFLGLWPIDAAGILFWTAGAGLIVLLGTDSRPAVRQHAIVATLALIGLIVAQSSVTVSGLWSTHLLVLLPLPQIAIAALAVAAGQRLTHFVRNGPLKNRPTAMAGVLSVLFVGSIVVGDVSVARSYHRDLAQTGGMATFSDAIYSLSDYLTQRPAGGRVIALDWGFKRPIQFLTLDRINPDDAYGYEEPPTSATLQAIADLVREPGNVFLFHTREAGIAYPRFDMFEAAARDIGKEPVLERRFFQRDGVPVYEVYTVRPRPSE
ncbi:MAG: glycosyltransferase family 39 protein [Chloroflexota bacterium]